MCGKSVSITLHVLVSLSAHVCRPYGGGVATGVLHLSQTCTQHTYLSVGTTWLLIFFLVQFKIDVLAN